MKNEKISASHHALLQLLGGKILTVLSTCPLWKYFEGALSYVSCKNTGVGLHFNLICQEKRTESNCCMPLPHRNSPYRQPGKIVVLLQSSSVWKTLISITKLKKWVLLTFSTRRASTETKKWKSWHAGCIFLGWEPNVLILKWTSHFIAGKCSTFLFENDFSNSRSL